jgi:hypothetical protein
MTKTQEKRNEKPLDKWTDKDRAEHNAEAWLLLENRELIERSASLGLSPDLHPEAQEVTGALATRAELVQLREAADAVAVEHTSAKFVKDWIAENRTEADDDLVAY